MARHTTEVFDSQTMLAETGLDSDELGDRLNLAGALGILYLLPSFFGAVGKTLEHRPGSRQCNRNAGRAPDSAFQRS